MSPTKVLTDENRLQEILDLRVLAYEHSEQKNFINRKLYPDGLSDILDDKSEHLIIEKEGEVIACARLTSLSTVTEIPFYHLSDADLPTNKSPLWFYSRLVVHPGFRGIGLSKKLDKYVLERFENLESLILILTKMKVSTYQDQYGFEWLKTIENFDKEDYPFTKQKPTHLFMKRWPK